MKPVAPAITVRPLTEEDAPVLVELLSPLITSAPYSAPLDVMAVRREIFGAPPPTVYPVRWQEHQRIGAWRAGQLVGFLDMAVGLDSDNLDQPDYRPLGLIRFMALPVREDLVNEVADALLRASQQFWEATGVGFVKAYHISTGYPILQAGAGLLPGEWAAQIRVLTSAGFLLTERYYGLYRVLNQAVEEVTPLADLSLVSRGSAAERTYQVYYRRIDWVGQLRLVRHLASDAGRSLLVAYIPELHIHERWRRQDIGKWLLRRAINDATLQGYNQMVVHLAHRHYAAMNLFVQLGFQELNYRGYTLERALTE